LLHKASRFRAVPFLKLGHEDSGEHDAKTGNGDAVEGSIAPYKHIRLTLEGESHEIVVIGVIRNDPRRIARVVEPDRLLFKAPA